MPARVVVVKRARRRSFALLWAAPAWIGSVWAALRGAIPAPSGVPAGDFPGDSGVPALRFSSDGAHLCSGCDLCVQICPSRALRLEILPGESRPEVTLFELEVGGCIGCGRCVEDCPEVALCMRGTPAVAIAGRSGRPESVDLLDRRGAGA